MSYQWISREEYRRLIHSPGWSVNPFGDWQWVAIYDESVRIIAQTGSEGIVRCFIVYEGGVKGLKSIITPPLAPYAGEARLNAANVLDFSALYAFLKEEGYSKVKLEFSPYTSVELNSQTGMTTRVTYRLDLPGSKSLLTAKYSSKTRNMVSKARREEARWLVNHDPGQSLRRILDHYDRKKIKSGRDQLSAVVDHLIKTERAFSIDVMEHDQVTWTGIFYLHENTCFYLAGALTPDHSSNASGTFGLYGAMCECIRRGVAVFDFEGSSMPAIARFVQGFGGTATPFVSYSDENWLWRLIAKIRQ
jgi:hypothetical protein